MCAYLSRSHLRGRNVDENLSTFIIPYFVHNVKHSISPTPLYHKAVGFSFALNRCARFLWMGAIKTVQTMRFLHHPYRCLSYGLTEKYSFYFCDFGKGTENPCVAGGVALEERWSDEGVSTANGEVMAVGVTRVVRKKRDLHCVHFLCFNIALQGSRKML